MKYLLTIIHRISFLPQFVWRWFTDHVRAPWRLRICGVAYGDNLRLYGVPVIFRDPNALIVLGDGVTLNSRPTSNTLYLAHPCVFAATKPGACIAIGNGVGMSGVNLVAAERIEIGDHTLIGAEVVIVDTDFHPLDPNQRTKNQTAGVASRPVRIGKHVFIGMRAIILKGVSIGDGAVIGAGAVVVKDVAPGVIVAGNPAKVISFQSSST